MKNRPVHAGVLVDHSASVTCGVVVFFCGDGGERDIREFAVVVGHNDRGRAETGRVQLDVGRIDTAGQAGARSGGILGPVPHEHDLIAVSDKHVQDSTRSCQGYCNQH
jgi:hypothetical protein